jgi:hypothetical protein
MPATGTTSLTGHDMQASDPCNETAAVRAYRCMTFSL